MTYSMSWSGNHNDFAPEAVAHYGGGGDLEDRLVAAVKHAVASILHSLGPDHEPRPVIVSASGHVPSEDISGTTLSLSVQVQSPPPPPVQASQAPADPTPTEADAPAAEGATEAAGGVEEAAPAPAADPTYTQPASDSPVSPGLDSPAADPGQG